MDQSASFSNLTWEKCYHHVDIFTDHEACLCFSPVYTGQSTDVTLFVCALQCITPVDFFHNVFMLHFFHIALCSCCTVSIMYLFCFVISAFSSCWKTFILYFGLFSCIFVSGYPFSCCNLLHCFHVTLFSCCTLFVLHFHNIKKYWKWTKEKTRAEKQKGRKFFTFCNWKAVALNLYFMNIGVCAKHFISTWKKQFLFLQILMFVITRFWCFISLVFGYQWNTKIFSSLIIIINVCRAQTYCTFMLHFF